ncbi:MAG: hypothetical protein HY716_00465 [Planctomycetes bacterium]|nr:hypothetical protein [Planctomycetota bacterium]
MKRSALVLFVLWGTGCVASPEDEGLKTLEARINAHVEKRLAETDRKLLPVDQKLASLTQLEQDTRKALGDLEKNARLLETANSHLIQMIEAHQMALKNELATLDAILQELKRK